MKNKIIVKEIEIKEYRIDYRYEILGDWKSCFPLNETFFVEYSINISDVPEGIAVIPFLCNLLPIAWVLDAVIVTKEVDEDFLKNSSKIKQGYINMFPMLDFKGRLITKPVKCSSSAGEQNSACFFSGGVDAFHTLISHRSEKPLLITVWGADITFEDIAGWNMMEKCIKHTAGLFDLNHITIKSALRRFIDQDELSKKIVKSGTGWWYGFQHGIGLLGHAAPVAYCFGLETVYIAASFSKDMPGKYVCASDPTIDNQVRFCGTKVYHDGYECNRQEKVRSLCSYSKEHNINLLLHVCWQSLGGCNCSKCEKCYRTILEIISEGYDPNDFNFIWNKKKMKECKRAMYHEIIAGQFILDSYYPPIQENFKKNRSRIKNYESYEWFLNLNFLEFNTLPVKRFNRSLPGKCLRRIRLLFGT
jgi:hypothetical protein